MGLSTSLNKVSAASPHTVNTPLSSESSIIALLQAQADACAASRHRRLVVIAGDKGWCRQQAVGAVITLNGEWCWIGQDAPQGTSQVAAEKATTQLGGEWQGVVVDAHAGFDADAFGAVAGTLLAGGLLLLLSPPLAEWRHFADPQKQRICVYPYEPEQVTGRYLARLASCMGSASEAMVIEQGRPLPEPLALLPAPSSSHEFDDCASADQQAAVEALCRVLHGHRRRPLVLVSDRGRGKTTALGLAAARLLQQGVQRVVVTAPRLAAVTPLFEHAAEQLPQASVSRGLLKLESGAELRFEPPDRLAHETIPCDLLLVDEAAAIPSPLLERMLRQHSRIAFATTVHGYEGTGRGFDLRFRKVLDAVTPQWRRLRMEQPIRWAEHDPLEQIVFKSLLLDAEPAAEPAVAGVEVASCKFELLDRDALASDEVLLPQLFGLLVLAHYRTSPTDLRHLLDGPNIQVAVLREGETVLATALLAAEGGMEEVLSQKVYRGERRLRGNLLPQSLTVHAGIADAATLRALRVMRIAVHPLRQGEGFGHRLVQEIEAHAVTQGFDYLGASFGMSRELIEFWQQQQYELVRVGLQREASSGLHAAMMVRPLSPAGNTLFTDARQRLSRQLSYLLAEPLEDLEPELVEVLFRGMTYAKTDKALWQDIVAFAFLNRDYGNSLAALHALVLQGLADGAMDSALDSGQRAMLIGKVLQAKSWQVVVSEHRLQGRGVLLQKLRDACASLCEHYGVKNPRST